ncbi:2,3-bisphosphoglycerate-independent phosphoglycerate mutase [Candidatus Micrarchaeota archaeon]|nr:2,3-bisphosphoglycerate-independent phosphoglycerate mutase [Candidatus Micrarchaeota archaeon]
MRTKAILLIMDGLGDLPNGKKTALQMAKKPNIDRLSAKGGIQGLMSVISLGVAPGSDTAQLQLLGYPPREYYCGRGPLEAFGAGMNLQEGDIAFRANFATMENNKITDRRAGRINTQDAKMLEKEVSMRINDVEIIFKSTTEHRGALILRGKGLSPDVSSMDTHHLGKINPAMPLDGSVEAKKTAEIMNQFTAIVSERLGKSKINDERAEKGLKVANTILLRGAGIYRRVPSFEERFGVEGACVAGGALYKGIGRYIGLDVPLVKGATGTKDTDLKSKGMAAVHELERHDFVFLHVKGTDNFSHDGDLKGKADFIGKVDKELIPILEKSGAVLIITGDHSTSCERKEHTGYEVPILVYHPEARCDGIKKFDEFSAMKGGLGHINGMSIMPFILNSIGKGKIYGS